LLDFARAAGARAQLERDAAKVKAEFIFVLHNSAYERFARICQHSLTLLAPAL
jgi:hypothetical protein